MKILPHMSHKQFPKQIKKTSQMKNKEEKLLRAKFLSSTPTPNVPLAPSVDYAIRLVQIWILKCE